MGGKILFLSLELGYWLLVTCDLKFGTLFIKQHSYCLQYLSLRRIVVSDLSWNATAHQMLQVVSKTNGKGILRKCSSRSVHTTPQLRCVAALHPTAQKLRCTALRCRMKVKFILTWNAVMLRSLAAESNRYIGTATQLRCSMIGPLDCGVRPRPLTLKWSRGVPIDPKILAAALPWLCLTLPCASFGGKKKIASTMRKFC